MFLKISNKYQVIFRPRLHRLAKEGSWIIIGQIGAVAGGLVLIRVLTEHLDPVQYGQLALGLTVATLVEQVVMVGVIASIGRFYSIAVEKQELHGYLRASRRLLGYATLMVMCIALVLSTGLLCLGYSHWMGMVTAALVFAVLSGFSSTLIGIQNAARQRAIAALHNSLDAWLKILLVLGAMFWLGTASFAVVVGYCCSSLLVTVSEFMFLRRTLPQNTTCSEAHTPFIRQMWVYSWPFSVWGIFTWMQLVSDRWALQAFTTTSNVGQYVVLFQLGYTPIVTVAGIAMIFLGPILYQFSGDATDNARNAHVHRLGWRMTFISLTVTFFGTIVAFTLHEWVFRLLVATKYREVSYLLPWFVMSGGLFAAGQMLALKLMSEMRSAKMTLAKISTALLGILFNVYGTSVAGLPGAVGAKVAFSIIYLAWMALLAYRLPQGQKCGSSG